MEKRGFVASDITDKPMTTPPALFAGAFLAHHRYQAAIDYLTQENAGLKEKVVDQASVRKKLESARLKQENEQLRALVAKIPPEVRREIQQRHSPRKGREERD